MVRTMDKMPIRMARCAATRADLADAQRPLARCSVDQFGPAGSGSGTTGQSAACRSSPFGQSYRIRQTRGCCCFYVRPQHQRLSGWWDCLRLEWPRAPRRGDPVSSRDGFTLSMSTREGRVESGPYVLRDSRRRTNCDCSGATNRLPSASSSGAPGHGGLVGNLGPCQRGVRRSQGPCQEVAVRRSSAPGHEHDRVWLNWPSTAAVSGGPTSRATTRSALWPIRKPTWGGQRANGSYRCASFTLRSSASVGYRRGSGPSFATRSTAARHLRFDPGRTAPESRTAARHLRFGPGRTAPESRTSAMVRGFHLGARCPGGLRCRGVVAGQRHSEARRQ